MKQYIYIIIVFLSTHLYSQDIERKTVPVIEYQAYAGGVIIHHSDMSHLNDNPYIGNELRLGFQTTGKDYWHHLFNYPTFGVGVYAGNYNYSVLGKPRAFFGFMELPFKRKEKSYFITNWSGGVCFNINKYDSISNPENIAIGSSVNIYVEFSLMYKRIISDKFEIGGGIKLQHFSNGAYSLPNLGLNMAGISLSLKYLSKRKPFLEIPKPKEYKKYEIITMYACGWKSYSESTNNIKHFNSTLSASINKRVTQKRTVGVGLDYFYQEYLSEYYPDKTNLTNKDLMSFAGFLSSELLFNKFRITTQLGFYMYRPVDFGLFFYERLGLRFYPTKWMFANISIKAHAAKAEFLEYGLGFKF
jgi:hypothetical protein